MAHSSWAGLEPSLGYETMFCGTQVPAALGFSFLGRGVEVFLKVKASSWRFSFWVDSGVS